jgi:CheY-like chemotaxis protein
MPILIAEDNVAQRRYVRELLEREFAKHLPVIEAADGEAAIELALAHKPALCVMDIQMPRLSGVKARGQSGKPIHLHASSFGHSFRTRSISMKSESL